MVRQTSEFNHIII